MLIPSSEAVGNARPGCRSLVPYARLWLWDTPQKTGAGAHQGELGDGMNGLVSWRGLAVMGSVAALFAAVVAMAPGALNDPASFEHGPRTTNRGTDSDDSKAFVVCDGNYL